MLVSDMAKEPLIKLPFASGLGILGWAEFSGSTVSASTATITIVFQNQKRGYQAWRQMASLIECDKQNAPFQLCHLLELRGC
jgi:hypothetical protein